MSRRSSRSDRERGAVIVLAALATVGIVIVAAIVVDLGQARAMRREAQSVADLATLAGTQAMTLPDGVDAAAGCEEAESYLKINIDDLPSGFTLDCDTVFAGLSCDGGTAPVVATDGGTAGRYSVEVTWPVADSMIADANTPGGASKNLRDFDGHESDDQCDRFAVEVGIDHVGFFSGIVGQDTLHAHADAVGRRLPYSDSRVPSLWLLEPHGCQVLELTGGGHLVVGAATASGLITVDSDASTCGSNQYVLSTGGSGEIDATPNQDPDYLDTNLPPLDPPGEISMFAVQPQQDGCVTQVEEDAGLGEHSACNPSDIDSLLVQPEPVRRPLRATRAPVDWTFNCKTGYPDYQGEGGSITIGDCPNAGDNEPYIDHLLTWMDDHAATPPGWTTYTGEGHSCSNPGEVTLNGHVIVDCDNFQLSNGDFVEFTGGNVVFQGSVKLTGGVLAINADVDDDGSGGMTLGADGFPTGSTDSPNVTLPGDCKPDSFTSSCWSKSSEQAAYIYQVDGGFSMTGGQVAVVGAAWIQDHDPPGSDGPNDFDATGTSSIWWRPPAEGPFLALSLWSEEADGPGNNTDYGIQGSGVLKLEGIFFIPEADPFKLAGGSGFEPQVAQFISRRLQITGGGDLELSPLGVPLITITPPAAILIR